MKVLLEEVSKGRQNIFVQKIIQGNNNLIRLELNSDSIEAQCRAVVSVFDKATNNWILLYQHFNHSVPSGLIHSINDNQSPDVLLFHFVEEIKHLQKISGKILKDKF